MPEEPTLACADTARERRLRVLALRRLVEEGDYFVTADELAQDILRHLGLVARAPMPQQR